MQVRKALSCLATGQVDTPRLPFSLLGRHLVFQGRPCVFLLQPICFLWHLAFWDRCLCVCPLASLLFKGGPAFLCCNPCGFCGPSFFLDRCLCICPLAARTLVRTRLVLLAILVLLVLLVLLALLALLALLDKIVKASNNSSKNECN